MCHCFVDQVFNWPAIVSTLFMSHETQVAMNFYCFFFPLFIYLVEPDHVSIIYIAYCVWINVVLKIALS